MGLLLIRVDSALTSHVHLQPLLLDAVPPPPFRQGRRRGRDSGTPPLVGESLHSTMFPAHPVFPRPCCRYDDSSDGAHCQFPSKTLSLRLVQSPDAMEQERGYEGPQIGRPVVVRTPDRREFRGRLMEMRERPDGRRVAVVRLDTGWITSFPAHMVAVDENER